MVDMPRVRFATASDGVRIAHTVTGEGPPLIYMPGWVSHLELMWHGLPGEFLWRLSRSRQLVVYDGRGAGLSDRDVDDVSLRSRLLDVQALVDHLRLERFALFGWSFSSPVAIVYTAEHPEQVTQLVLYAAFCDRGGREEGEAKVGRALVDLIRAEWGVGARTTLGFVHPDADREEVADGLAYMRASSSGDVAARLLEESFFEIQVCDQVTQIAAPALVLHKREDNAVPLEAGRRVASLLPNARFQVLEGHDHLPWHDNAEATLRAIEEFLGGEAASWTPVAAAHPDAPLTLLFTDIEGSTSLTQRLGDAAAQEVLRAHNAIVREALAANGGSEVKHTGDGIMASFPSASRAVECAIAIQRAVGARARDPRPATLDPLKVRIGLNAGEPVREDDDLFGTAVQLARRVCDAAGGGEILVTDVVRQLAMGKVFVFSERESAALKGFDEPVRLYEVAWET